MSTRKTRNCSHCSNNYHECQENTSSFSSQRALRTAATNIVLTNQKNADSKKKARLVKKFREIFYA